MDGSREIAERIKRRLRSEAGALLETGSLEERRASLRSAALALLHEEGVLLGSAEQESLLELISDDIIGLGALEPLLKDPEVTEIMVNGHGSLYVEREGELHRLPALLPSEAVVLHTIDRILGPLGLRVDESCPFADARLPDGSRVNIIIAPLSLSGAVVTIRKFSSRRMSMAQLVEAGSCPPAIATLLGEAVRGRLNLMISGGTGSGKTTLLNALAGFIPDSERLITIEDAAELRIPKHHVVRLESRPPNSEGRGEITIRMLLRNALRMRPDRIIIGEVRGPEALDLLQAMNTGHEGSLSTAHANSPADLLRRLETMALQASVGLPASAIRDQIGAALDLVVHLERQADGTRRIVEVARMDRTGSGAALAPLFRNEGLPRRHRRDTFVREATSL